MFDRDTVCCVCDRWKS